MAAFTALLDRGVSEVDPQTNHPTDRHIRVAMRLAAQFTIDATAELCPLVERIDLPIGESGSAVAVTVDEVLDAATSSWHWD